jgi:thermitase
MPDSNLFYWYDGNKVLLNPSPSKRAVKFVGETDSFAKASTIKQFSNSEKSSGIDLGNGITLLDTAGVSRFNPTKEFKAQNNFKEFMVFEADANKNLMILTDEIIIKLKSAISNTEKDDFFKKYSDNVTIKNQVNDSVYVVAVNDSEGTNTLDIANELNNDKLVDYAHPNFTRSLKPFFSPNDTLFSKQWALSNNGQTGGIAGNDINVIAAWKRTTGSDKISIAIIDEGVDYAHEDLDVNNKLLKGYDALTGQDDPGPENNDAHGTACAGIAAGAGNNNKGISGVAPGCKIIGIRIGKSVGDRWVTDDVKIADGIAQAYKRNADVLSNSWGGGSPSMHITQAIRDAKKYGRNGKGCVVCFAAGNDNRNVSFPGSLPEVITVAACNEYGERKGINSKDGETWWGSNFGPEIDVCAPGVHITTTDISGSRGYSKTTDYYESFNGTSAATPHVAGVAALVLSVNPNLTATEVENILRKATDDLGVQGFNVYTGFGRINAGKAVLLA